MGNYVLQVAPDTVLTIKQDTDGYTLELWRGGVMVWEYSENKIAYCVCEILKQGALCSRKR